MKDLTEVASISGKSGLYRILKPGRSGVILESMDEKKTKLVSNPTQKVSILAEVSLYTNSEDGAKPLDEILYKIFKEFGKDPGVDGKSSPDELMSFLEYIVPEYDHERVYPSDVKKLVSWYHILLNEAPELLKEPAGGKDKEKPDEKKAPATSRVPKGRKTDPAKPGTKPKQTPKNMPAGGNVATVKSGKGKKP